MKPEDRMRNAKQGLVWEEVRARMDEAAKRGDWWEFGATLGSAIGLAWVSMPSSKARAFAASIAFIADEMRAHGGLPPTAADDDSTTPTAGDLALAVCPGCSHGGITRALVKETWPYGDAHEPDKQVTLSAIVPQFSCAGCGFTWTDHVAEEIRDAATRRHVRASRHPVIRIHVLVGGFVLCRFLDRPRGQWPIGEIWIRREEYEDTHAACLDPEHELHAVMRHAMCDGCVHAMTASGQQKEST